MAGACKWWEALRTKEEIKSEFRTLMASGNRGKIASLYPDVAALMWVLDGVDIVNAVADVEQELDPTSDSVSSIEDVNPGALLNE
jgi:hypothetical protein